MLEVTSCWGGWCVEWVSWKRSDFVPLEFHSPHTRSAPTESDTDAPPSAAPSRTPPGLPSPSLKPDVEVKPCSIKPQQSDITRSALQGFSWKHTPSNRFSINAAFGFSVKLFQHFHPSYLLNQPVDFQLLLPFVHLFFLFGKFQLKLHLLFVFPLLLQRVCVGHFLLFLLLFSFLRCHQ